MAASKDTKEEIVPDDKPPTAESTTEQATPDQTPPKSDSLQQPEGEPDAALEASQEETAAEDTGPELDTPAEDDTKPE